MIIRNIRARNVYEIIPYGITFVKCSSLLLAAGLLSGCNYFRNPSEEPNTSGYNLEQVKKEMPALNLSEPVPPSAAIVDYFNFYDLNPKKVKHLFGTAESEGGTLAIHLFMPEKPRGTLFLLHGYFDHAGTLSKLIAEGLAHDYAILSWDLPGHGLSSGARTETGQFDLCARQFVDAVKRAAPVLPQPFNLIAHSTGCSIAIEYMYNAPTNAFEEIIFLAPLVRHTYWELGKFGYTIAHPFSERIRRRAINNSSDEAFRDFVKNDPLHSSDLSFNYLGDLYKWEKRARKYPVWPGTLYVIQGDNDNVVDWQYNLKFLSSKVEHVEVRMIPGAKHQLANERKELRDQVFQEIFNALQSKDGNAVADAP